MKIWSYFSNIGIEGLPQSEAVRVRLVNRCCMLFALLSVVCIIPWVMEGNLVMVLANLALIPAYAFLLYLNHRRYYDIPKFLLIFFAITPVFIVSAMLGIQKSHIHFSMIPVAGASILLFDRQEKWKILTVMGYTLILLSILIIAQEPILPNIVGDKITVLPVMDYLINFGIIFAAMYSFYHFYISSENSLIEERARAANASKMAALGSMAGAIAHEINSPLFLINAHSFRLQQSLQKDPVPLEDLIRYSAGIQETCERISSIIRSLTTFSRSSENDPMILVKPSEIIADVMMICHHRYYQGNIPIEQEIPEDLPEIMCRPVEIAQILINLLNNAYDAVSSLEAPAVRLKVKNSNDWMQFLVEDNGAGIPDEKRARIFENFYTTKSPGKGTGLGLSISKRIADAHHGRLTFTSSPGETSFRLELPLKKASAGISAECPESL